MTYEKKGELALKGVGCVLTVDSWSNELTDLYIRDTELWRYLVGRFGGNKMMVTLRGPHDYKRGLMMPPDIVIEKLVEWKKEDGTAQGLRDIADEILETLNDEP